MGGDFAEGSYADGLTTSNYYAHLLLVVMSMFLMLFLIIFVLMLTSYWGADDSSSQAQESSTTTNTESAKKRDATLDPSQPVTPVVPVHLGMWQFYVGLGLAMSSSVFIGTSFILKKKALIRLASSGNACRAGAGGFGYLRDWLWWAGVLTMGLGEAFNFTAYAFAPASLVTPLGALSVLVTTILSSKLLREKLNLLGKIGCCICVLGSTVIVLHSPKEENIRSMVELGHKMQQMPFLIYVFVIVTASTYLAVVVAPKSGTQNILVFVAICSMIGSLSVLGCKGFGLAVKETLEGNNQFFNLLTWAWLLLIIVCVSVQLNYLNKSLDVFNTAMVTPVYYVFFTSFVILASGILYEEWAQLSLKDIVGNIIGFLITIIGIFQMQLFKDYNVTLVQLRKMLWKNTSQSSNNVSLNCNGSVNNNNNNNGANSPLLGRQSSRSSPDRMDTDSMEMSQRGNGTGLMNQRGTGNGMTNHALIDLSDHRTTNTSKRMLDATTTISWSNSANHLDNMEMDPIHEHDTFAHSLS